MKVRWLASYVLVYVFNFQLKRLVALIKEHEFALTSVNDSYLKTLLPDHVSPTMQITRQVNTLKSYRIYFWKKKRRIKKFKEVNYLAAETICGQLFIRSYKPRRDISCYKYLTVFNKSIYCKFCSCNIYSSFFCLHIYKSAKRILQ